MYLKGIGVWCDLIFFKICLFILFLDMCMFPFPACCFHQRTYVAQESGTAKLSLKLSK